MNCLESHKTITIENKTAPEEKETMGKGHKIVIDFVRHGAAIYDGEQRPEDKKDTIQFEGVLTEEGLKQIEATAEEIIKKIDDESKELIILWRSPRKRTEESMNKLKEILLKNGINIFPKNNLAKENQDLIDLELTEEFLEEYDRQSEQNENLTWMEFWKEESANFKNVENENDFMERMQKLISYFQQFSQKAKLPKDIKIRFICLTHEEEIKNIAELFGVSIKDVKNGEVMEMNVSPQKDTPVEFDIKIQEQKGHLSSDQLFRKSI